MNDLLRLQVTLIESLTYDVQTALALIVTLLDPLWLSSQDLEPRDEDYEDPLFNALVITRRCFPELYIEAIAAGHANQSAAQIEALLLAGFDQLGLAIDQLEGLCWGIPLNAYGLQLDEPDFETNYPEAVELLGCFGNTLSDAVYTVAAVLAASLELETPAICHDIAIALSWLFGFSRNSLVALSYEELVELEPLQWTPDDVEFAIEMISEAESLMAQAQNGLHYLSQHPLALAQIQANVQYLAKYPKIQDVQAFVERHPLDWSAFV